MCSPLQRTRKAAKKTLETVAAAVGTDTGNLSRIERGLQTPSSELAEKLAKHFGPPLTSVHVMCPEHFANTSSVSDDLRAA